MRIIKFMLFMLLMVVAYHVRAEPTRVKFPEKVKEMVHYTTVRRSNVVEHIVANREAIEAVKKKQPIPNGSTFVCLSIIAMESCIAISSWKKVRAGEMIMIREKEPVTGNTSGTGLIKQSINQKTLLDACPVINLRKTQIFFTLVIAYHILTGSQLNEKMVSHFCDDNYSFTNFCLLLAG
jgi:hypothetical protein